MGERSAVKSNSGATVSQSVPGLRRPTPPVTAGRKPAARPPVLLNPVTPEDMVFQSRAAGLSQPKTGQGFGDRVPDVESQREALGSLKPSGDREAGALNASDPELLDDYSVRQLLEFFEILDRWDREAHGTKTM